MKQERIAQELRLHNAWRRGEGVFDGVTPAPMPHTPKELGELIEAAAINCEHVQLLATVLAWYGEQARLARLIHSEGDVGRNALANDGGRKAKDALKKAGLE